MRYWTPPEKLLSQTKHRGHAPISRANVLCVRTTLDIDAKLVEEAVNLSGERTKAAAVEAALREYVRLRRKELLLGLPAKISQEENWRELREAELDE